MKINDCFYADILAIFYQEVGGNDALENNVIKVELGCGRSKTRGYIGIDRFQMPGVDIVANLNNGIPLGDNSVDVIYASHSLEHLDNIFFTMKEIYRVLKDRGILLILAPYYTQTLNMVNFFHKTAFTEELFRFLSPFASSRFSSEECECPHADIYPLSQSDNSDNNIALEPLYKELFYYEAYRGMSEDAKLHARKSLLNVCDQFYIALAANKSGYPFSYDTLNELETLARKLEPEIVGSLRKRDKQADENKKSLYTDMDSRILSLTITKEEFTDRLDKIIELDNQHKQTVQQHDKQIISLESCFSNLVEDKNRIEDELMAQKERLESYAAVILDLIRFQERRTKIFGGKIYRKSHDLLPSLMSKENIPFIDGLYLGCKYFSANRILTFSDAVPFDRIMEYKITGYGNEIHFFVIATPNAKLEVRIAHDDKTYQKIIDIKVNGSIKLNTEEIKGNVLIGFRTIDNYSVVRILQVTLRKFLLYENSKIASFIK